jgi:hypothetical protein
MNPTTWPWPTGPLWVGMATVALICLAAVLVCLLAAATRF